jgi:hypothetical protein
MPGLMSNERREEIYLRDRSVLTPKQRRRIKQKTQHHELIGKYGRLRRAFLKKENREVRERAKAFVPYVRQGGIRLSRAKQFETLEGTPDTQVTLKPEKRAAQRGR